MSEGPPKNQERSPESIPSPEDIAELFEKLTGRKDYTEVSKEEDERGISVWIISIETEEGRTEYEYFREVLDPPNNPKTVVYASFYDKDDRVIMGNTAAHWMNNKWKTEFADIPKLPKD